MRSPDIAKKLLRRPTRISEFDIRLEDMYIWGVNKVTKVKAPLTAAAK